MIAIADLDLDQCKPRAAKSHCQGGQGARNAPGAIFVLCWRSAARAVVYCGRVFSRKTGLDKTRSLSARHSYPFGPKMAGAHRVRYQRPDNRSDFDRRCRGYRPGPRSSCRGFHRCEGQGGLCDAEARGRATAVIQHKNADSEATTSGQDRQEARTGAKARDGPPRVVWLVRKKLLVKTAVCPSPANRGHALNPRGWRIWTAGSRRCGSSYRSRSANRSRSRSTICRWVWPRKPRMPLLWSCDSALDTVSSVRPR